MRVLFVNGPTQDPCHAYYGWPTSLLYAIAPSFAAMRAGSLEVEYEQELFDPAPWVGREAKEQISRELERRLATCDVLCASVTYDSLWPVLCLFEHAKRVRPEVITVLGGPHVDETHDLPAFSDAQRYPELIDYAIAGDADLALLALLRGLAAGRDRPLCDHHRSASGVFTIYRRGQVISRGSQPLVLDALPFIPVELADTPARRTNLARLTGDPSLGPVVELIAQRGCRFQCTCCSERQIPLNARSVQSVLQEVQLRAEQGFDCLFFNDSTFGLYAHLPELLDVLGATGMSFGCLNRFDFLANPRLVAAYRRAGFRYFYCAVEQFDDSLLGQLEKGENTRRMERAMQLLHEHEMIVGVSLLYGLAGESRKTIERTMNFVQRWVEKGVIRLVSQSVLSLHPGTPMGKNLDQKFDRPAPHNGYFYDRFEEGLWYHLPHVTAGHLEWIATEAERRFGRVLVRRRDAQERA